MRVVAGSAGGLALQVPPEDIRPTMDRVKGAIFSSLGDRVPGARVLDLFAGAGGLGIEALSRGAARVTLVDHQRQCVDIIRRNLNHCRLEANVQCMDALRFLEHYAEPGSYDLILADPPYTKQADDRDWVAALLRLPSLPGILSPDGLLVIEAYSRAVPEIPPAWSQLKRKDYGETAVLYLEPT